MLHHKATVFEHEPAYSLYDLIGKIIPQEPGFVGCCYRLSKDYPKIDFFYARSPDATFNNIRESALYNRVSMTNDRKKEKEGKSGSGGEAAEDDTPGI